VKRVGLEVFLAWHVWDFLGVPVAEQNVRCPPIDITLELTGSVLDDLEDIDVQDEWSRIA